MLTTLELPRNRHAPAIARIALGALAAGFEPRVVDDARLLLSELVTNSVRHGAGDAVRIRVQADPSRGLRCEVDDDGAGFIPMAPATDRDVGGWGLQLIDRLAQRWGVVDASTHVWFELSAHGDRQPARAR